MKNKFRGRRVDNGEWVYGDLIQLFGGRKYIIDNKFGACIDEIGNFINTGYPFVNDVIPETVGQFTGLRDKNGKEIYEGDIIGFRRKKKECIDVCYDKGSYLCKVKTGINSTTLYRLCSFIDKYQCEVIGNIYENKELMEEINNG